MKQLISMLPLVVLGHMVSAQEANVKLVVNDRSSERANVLRSSLLLSEPEENIFWPLYKQYEQRLRTGEECTLLSLNQPSSGNSSMRSADCMKSIFENLVEEVSLRGEYFEKINKSLNGLVAFQFLQMEVLLELIEKSRLYENLNWNQPQWHRKMIKDETMKRSVIAFTLGLDAIQREKFLPVYENYEFEYSRVVGHQFVWFEQYIEDTGDLTPAVARKLGKELLHMQQREIKVRQAFFEKMTEAVGEEVAARFIALEDYFSMMAKLNVWAELASIASR